METDIIITGNIATWLMPPTNGEILGTYTGTFQFKCWLNPLEQLQAGREYREFLGREAGLATETEGNMGFALAQLKHRVIKAPPFWTSTLQDSGYSGNIPDLNILILVLEKAIQAENLYKEKMEAEREALLNRAIAKSEEMLQKQKGDPNES